MTMVPTQEPDSGISTDKDLRDVKQDPNLAAALKLAAAGLPVLPVRVFRDKRGRWRKQPAIREWQARASTEPEVIKKWWLEFPQAVPGSNWADLGLLSSMRIVMKRAAMV